MFSMFSMFLSFFFSFFVISAAIAAPSAPKGASADLRDALKGVACSSTRKGDWKVGGAGGGALERLTVQEDEVFQSLADQWAKDNCSSTRKGVSGGTTSGGKRSDRVLVGALIAPFAVLMVVRIVRSVRITMRSVHHMLRMMVMRITMRSVRSV